MKGLTTILGLATTMAAIVLLTGCGGGGSDCCGGGGGGGYYPPPSVNQYSGNYTGTWNNVNDSTAYGDSDLQVDDSGNVTGDLLDSSGNTLGTLSGTVDDYGNFTGAYSDGTVTDNAQARFSQSGPSLHMDLDIDDPQGTYQLSLDLTNTNRSKPAFTKTGRKSPLTTAKALGTTSPTRRFTRATKK